MSSRAYRSLDPALILETAERISRRICERFPSRGLARVGEEVVAVARGSTATLQSLNRPLLALRVAVAVVIGVLLATEVGTTWWIATQREAANWSDFIQGLDAGLNSVIVSAGAVVFLVTSERRLKRRKVLSALQQLRVLMHIVEMHQLDKDPERFFITGPQTPSSPRQDLNPFLLVRYLDYCTELLAVLSNLAAVYAQGYDDQVVLDSVDALATVCNGMSNKISLKMTVVNQLPGERLVAETSAAVQTE